MRSILLVDDDDVDAMAVRRVLKELGVADKLVRTASGEEALAYLRGKDNETPCVVLLDLNMPKMNGIEFLMVVRAEEKLKGIPVIVVTTSTEREDMAKSFELGAAAYVVKSLDYGEFRQNIRTIERYLDVSPGFRCCAQAQ